MKKNLTVRLNEKTIENMSNAAKRLDCSYSELIEKQFNAACKILAGGGAIVTIPNPNNCIYTSEESKKAFEILNEAAYQLNKNNCGLDFGVNAVLRYAKEKLSNV